LEKFEIVAKAVDVAGKAAESISKELAALIQPLLRPGMEATGEMIADQINYWRLKRRVALVEKVMQLLESKNIKPKSVPPKILAAVLNTGSLEEDETLTAKWAGLLASAAAGSALHPSYPSILDQLSPDEAGVLDAMYQRLIENPSDKEKASFSLGDLRKTMSTSAEQLRIILGNLKRLELCRIHDEIDRFYGPDMNNSYKLNLTGLGEDFIKACSGPRSIHEKPQTQN
jgi:hypothetical protein